MTLGAGADLPGVLIVVALVCCLIIAAAWVHSDAQAHVNRGRPIVSTIASIQLRTPVAWFFACLLVPEFALPVYLDSRSPA